MTHELQSKVEYSINLLKRGERLALALNPADGYYLAFSGGKDSQCVMELAKMAGVVFKAYYSVTGIDEPLNVHFIQNNYPNVVFVHPKENYFRLVEKKGMPLIRMRFCCERLKENFGSGNLLLDGVRAQESVARSKYVETMVFSNRNENKLRGRNRQLDDIIEKEHRCIRGKDKVVLHPILSWSENNVWEFIKEMRIPINPCYKNVSRVGCMYCPFAKKKQLAYYEMKYPLYYKRLLLALDRFRTSKNITGLCDSEDIYQWWLSKLTVDQYISQKKQLKLF